MGKGEETFDFEFNTLKTKLWEELARLKKLKEDAIRYVDAIKSKFSNFYIYNHTLSPM